MTEITCSICNTVFDDSSIFCPFCGYCRETNDFMTNKDLYWQEGLAKELHKICMENGIKWPDVIVALKGSFKEYLIATDSMVYIIKKGFMTGHTFGSGNFKMPYVNITNAEVDYHFASGYFEISSGGMQNTRKSYWSNDENSTQKAPNVVSITGKDLKNTFVYAANIITRKIAESHQPTAIPTPQQSATVDPVNEIRKYKQLADDGIITQEEFEAKKKQLLGI